MNKSNGRGETRRKCTCARDPSGPFPADLWPHAEKKSNLRQVTCPGCGQVYRTNRQTDLCMDCERSQG